VPGAGTARRGGGPAPVAPQTAALGAALQEIGAAAEVAVAGAALRYAAGEI
jgi:hypothetical protein